MRILLVEDDRDLASTIKEELDNAYIVELTFSGEAGEYSAC